MLEVAVILGHHQDTPSLGGDIDHGAGIVERCRKWLLGEDVFAGAHELLGDRAVRGRRGDDDRGVELEVRDGVVERGEHPARVQVDPFSRRLPQGWHRLDDSNEVDGIRSREHIQPVLPHLAGAYLDHLHALVAPSGNHGPRVPGCGPACRARCRRTPIRCDPRR